MHNAAWYGHPEFVQLLIDHNASITKTDKHNRSPLFFACLGKSEKTVHLLLDALITSGAPFSEINTTTKRGRTPLRQAAAHGFVKVVETLLALDVTGEAVRARDSRKGRTALHCAAFRGRYDVVALLLKIGADTSLQDGINGDGLTALELCHTQWAIIGSKEYETTVAMLIDHDPQKAAQDRQLLATAAVHNSRFILEKLHAAGADLKMPDRYGWTPLALAKDFQATEAANFLEKQLALIGVPPTHFITTRAGMSISEDGRLLSMTQPSELPIGYTESLLAELILE
jgi:ankyrin repeat protein